MLESKHTNISVDLKTRLDELTEQNLALEREKTQIE